MGTVFVVGSINQDHVFSVDRRPQAGETVSGATLVTRPGGKGANQAAAAAASGATVTMLGRVGADTAGAAQRDDLAARGVDVSLVTEVTEAGTGSAFVVVTPDGENAVVIAAGANGLLRAADVRAWAGEHGFACTESIRPAHVLKCGAAGVAVLDPKAPPTDQIAFAFAPDGRLIGVDRLRSTLTPPEASRLFGEAAEALGAALGPAELAGEATPAYLAGGVMHTARLAYRFSDYLATVTAMNVGRRVVLHEQYESARGG